MNVKSKLASEIDLNPSSHRTFQLQHLISPSPPTRALHFSEERKEKVQWSDIISQIQAHNVVLFHRSTPLSAKIWPTSSFCSRLAPLFSCFSPFPPNPHKKEGKVFYEKVFILKNSTTFAKGFCFRHARFLKRDQVP